MTEPWISFHAPWKSRARSGLVVFEQIQRFVGAVAVDPAPSSVRLAVHEDHGEPLRRLTRELPGTDANQAQALAAIGYRPGPLITLAQQRFGGGTHQRWAQGSSGFLFAWTWERDRPPIELPPFIDFFRAHEALPRAGAMPQVDVTVTYDFEVKRPGTSGALFPGASLRSSVMVWLGSRSVNLSVRYQTPEFTPALREIHAEIVAALGPKTPRHALQQIIPARRPGGRERRVRLA